MTAKKVLLIGLDPQGFDYASSPFPDLTPEIVTKGLDADLANLNAEGYNARMVLVDPGGDAAAVISNALTEKFDCLLLGAALRTTPKYFLLFETVINLVHQAAPDTKICFNTGPHDSLDAIRRWV
jgi:hypothetical protein